jgi:hypothetical protein
MPECSKLGAATRRTNNARQFMRVQLRKFIIRPTRTQMLYRWDEDCDIDAMPSRQDSMSSCLDMNWKGNRFGETCTDVGLCEDLGDLARKSGKARMRPSHGCEWQVNGQKPCHVTATCLVDRPRCASCMPLMRPGAPHRCLLSPSISLAP